MTGIVPPESLVDRWIERSVSYYGDSDTYLKYHCIFASPVVGKYAIGGTKQIADGIRRSPSTVENHAHAHWMYGELRKNGHIKQVRALWRVLPASFWWHAWDIHTKGYNAYYYLNNAHLNRESVRDMLFSFRRDVEAGSAPLQLTRAIQTMRLLGEELLQKIKLDDKKIEKANYHLREFVRIVEGEEK